MTDQTLQPDSVEELTKGINPHIDLDTAIADPVNVTEEKAEAEEKKEEKENAAVTDPEPAPVKRKRGRPRKIDQMSPLEQVTLHAQRNTYAVEMADKQTKKEIYAADPVFVEDGDELQAVETDATIRHEEYLELVASAQDNRILKGMIESVTEVPSNMDADDPAYIPQFMARVKFRTGKFVITIPSFVLYDYHYERMNKAMAFDIQKNIMRRIGSEVTFVVRHVDEKAGTAIGDRLAALSMRGVRNYTSINGRKPRIIPGMIVQAKICGIARDYILVDAAGAECRIPLEEISWLFNADARDFDGIKTEECYRVGEPVNVKILKIEPKKVKVIHSSYTLIDIVASIKQAKANPRNKYFNDFNVGDIFQGYITGITESGIYVNLSNKIDCLCKFPTDTRRMPCMGESVIVQIFAKDEEKKFIYGNLK